VFLYENDHKVIKLTSVHLFLALYY